MFLIILLFLIFSWVNYYVLIMCYCKYKLELCFKINLYCYFIAIIWSIIILIYDLYTFNIIIYLIFMSIMKKRD